MNSDDMFDRLVNRKKKEQPKKSKKGRPATGKRSSDDWVIRTFYLRKETDQSLDIELLRRKHNGSSIDKSELIDKLISEWLKSHKAENT